MKKNKGTIMVIILIVALIITLTVGVIRDRRLESKKTNEDTQQITNMQTNFLSAPNTPGVELSWTRGGKSIPKGNTGDWDESGVLPENIIKVGSTYWCVYLGSAGGIGLASSTDMINWTKFSGNPIIRDHSMAPHIYQEDGLFYIFTGDSPICLYSAPTVTGPYTLIGPVLQTSDTGFDDVRVLEPFVIKINGIYYMYYMGDQTTTAPHKEQVGVATATSITGPYTKYEMNPILPYGASGQWDDGLTADPWAVDYTNTDGYIYLGYAGGQPLGAQSCAATGIARSKNPLGPFERCPSNPIVKSKVYDVNDTTYFDATRIFRGALFIEDSNFWLLYCGRQGEYTTPEGYMAKLQSFPPNWDTPTETWTRLEAEAEDSRIAKRGKGWTSTPQSLASDGKILATKESGDTLTLTFIGGGIKAYGRIASSYGIAGFTIDDGTEKLVDSFYLDSNHTFVDRVKLFESTNLSYGKHTLKIRVTGTKNTSSTDTWSALDFFEILTKAN